MQLKNNLKYIYLDNIVLHTNDIKQKISDFVK